MHDAQAMYLLDVGVEAQYVVACPIFAGWFGSQSPSC
jgi:hypothetical protein